MKQCVLIFAFNKGIVKYMMFSKEFVKTNYDHSQSFYTLSLFVLFYATTFEIQVIIS